MTKREKFIFNKIKEVHPMVLIMDEEIHDTRFFVLYNEKVINFVLVRGLYILPTLITLQDFLSLYSDDDILAAILRDVL